MKHFGYRAPDSTVYIPFDSFDSDGASVTITDLALTDIKVYKDGGATERSSTAGFALLDTDGIDFDGLTGIHGISIDLSDDTDSGFYASGSHYWVIIDAVTVDSQTVRFVAGTFDIGYQPVNVVQVSGDATAADNLEAAFDGTGYDLGGIDVSELNTSVDAIGSDGSGLTEAGGTGDHLTALPYNSAWDAEIQSEVTDALNAYDPPTKTEMDAGFTSLNDISAADVNAQVDSALLDYDAPTKGELDSGLAALNDLDAAAIRTALGLSSANLDTQLSTIDTEVGQIKAVTDNVNDTLEDDGGTYRFTTNALEQAPTGGSAPTAAAIADAVLDEALSGHATAGTLGKAIADIESDATAILADTDELQTNQGNWLTSDVSGLATSAALTAVKAKTDEMTFTVSGKLDCNIHYVHDIEVTGLGSSASPWGPAS